jgi:hypothetical protein
LPSRFLNYLLVATSKTAFFTLCSFPNPSLTVHSSNSLHCSFHPGPSLSIPHALASAIPHACGRNVLVWMFCTCIHRNMHTNAPWPEVGDLRHVLQHEAHTLADQWWSRGDGGRGGGEFDRSTTHSSSITNAFSRTHAGIPGGPGEALRARSWSQPRPRTRLTWSCPRRTRPCSWRCPESCPVYSIRIHTQVVSPSLSIAKVNRQESPRPRC